MTIKRKTINNKFCRWFLRTRTFDEPFCVAIVTILNDIGNAGHVANSFGIIPVCII